MYLTTLIPAILLAAGSAEARRAKYIPGGTELTECGPNKVLKPTYATAEILPLIPAYLALNFTSSESINGGSGTLYVTDAHTFAPLDEVEFDICKDWAHGNCPIDGKIASLVIFNNGGRNLWDVDLALDIFSADGKQQITCLYGHAAPKPEEEMVDTRRMGQHRVKAKVSEEQKIVVDVHWDM